MAYRQPAPGQGRSFLGGVIVARRPLSREEVARVEALLARDRLEPVLLPGREPRGQDAGALRAAGLLVERGVASAGAAPAALAAAAPEFPYSVLPARGSSVLASDLLRIL